MNYFLMPNPAVLFVFLLSSGTFLRDILRVEERRCYVLFELDDRSQELSVQQNQRQSEQSVKQLLNKQTTDLLK